MVKSSAAAAATGEAQDDVSQAGFSETSSFMSFVNFLNSPAACWRGPAAHGPPQNLVVDPFHNEKPGKAGAGGARPLRLRDPSTSSGASTALWAARTFFLSCAFLLALFPSVIKMYETSHWFREGDPSVYDDAKDWFSNEKLPFQSYFDSSKVLMRIYFFIVPYILSAACVSIALALKGGESPLKRRRELKSSRRAAGSFLRRSLRLPAPLVKVGFPARLSVAELLGVLVFLTLNFMTIGVRVRRSLPRGSRKVEFLVDADGDAAKEPIPGVSWQATEVWGKTLGVVSILNLGWYLLLPIGRKSCLLDALGVSWERAVRYHRWCGYYSVFVMLVHSIMYVAVWVHGDGNPAYDNSDGMAARNLVPWYCQANECSDGEARTLRINMYGFTTMFLVMVMTVFTLPWIRRQKFEWFFYTHMLFVFVLVFVCLHYKGSIIYILPGIAVYSVDKLMGLYAYRKAQPVNTRMLSSDVLEISFRCRDGADYRAGDYVFLNVPSVSFAQWHPFSLTSAPSLHGDEVHFHLKGAGAKDSWTRRVIAEAQKDGDLVVRLDGYYGVAGDVCDRLAEKDGVVLVGGGIGVTPMMSLAQELYTASRVPVTLLWTARTVEEYAIFSDELEDAQRDNDHFRARAWVTLSSLGAEERESLRDVDRFRTTLRSSRALQPSRGGGSPFKLDRPGATGAFNAGAMAFGIFFALIALALATRMSNGDKYMDTAQDYISLMDLSLVTLFSFLWVPFVVVAMRFLPRRKVAPLPYGKDDSLDATTAHMTSHGLDGTTHHSSHGMVGTSDSSDADEEHAGEKSGGLVGSVVTADSLGCRPDIAEELSRMGRDLVERAGGPVDIAVLACGPAKMLDSIDDYVNIPSSEGYAGGDDRQAFFSFIEEDWEW